MEEIEVKFLEISIEDIEHKLESIGAQKIGETLSQITNFDYPDYRLKEIKAWVRLRSEFGKTTLSYKQRLGVTAEDGLSSDAGMKEIEISVSDFETTRKFLHAIGLIEKFSQERKRIRWIKEDVEFDIDTWPLVPSYLEIEGPSWEKVKQAAADLGLQWSDHLKLSFGQVCRRYGFDDHDYSIFTFTEQIKK
jgi:adenylate cyclase class 2